MVSYEVKKPPLGFFERVRESVRLANAFIKGDKTTISNITAETIFSPLQPIQPFTPQAIGRQYDYQPGYNVNFQPRSEFPYLTKFWELRRFAQNCEILRLGIETCIDQICSFDWQFVPKEDSDMAPDDPKIAEITEFFKSPDKVHTFKQWLGAIVEELLVTDAVAIYRSKDKLGRPYAFELMDGSTIKILIDGTGRLPQSPDPAYQQIIKGAPRVDYDTTELLYRRKKVRVFNPYGYPAVEQILTTAKKAIQRDIYQLSYFTQGSVPDAYAEMPEGMTPDQIRAFEDRFNSILSGNAVERKRVPFLPSGSKISQLKEAILTDAFDEWMARLVCFCLSLPPNAFVKQQNRATANSEKDRAEQEGQAPRLAFLKDLVDSLIADFGPDYADDIEAKPKESANQDPKVQADVLKELVGSGIKTINEGRADLGYDPVPGGDKPMVLTPTGYVPLDAFEQNQLMQQQTIKANADAKAQAAKSPPKDQAKPPSGKDASKGYGMARKAVRHEPIPLAVPPSGTQKAS